MWQLYWFLIFIINFLLNSPLLCLHQLISGTKLLLHYSSATTFSTLLAENDLWFEIPNVQYFVSIHNLWTNMACGKQVLETILVTFFLHLHSYFSQLRKHDDKRSRKTIFQSKCKIVDTFPSPGKSMAHLKEYQLKKKLLISSNVGACKRRQKTDI